jgi:hypothetical protein
METAEGAKVLSYRIGPNGELIPVTELDLARMTPNERREYQLDKMLNEALVLAMAIYADAGRLYDCEQWVAVDTADPNKGHIKVTLGFRAKESK